MSPVNCAHKLIGITFILVLLVACSAIQASAQTEISYDWQTRSVTSCPSEVNRRRPGKIVINNLNDILYNYKVGVTETTAPIDDFAAIKDLITRSARPAAQAGDAAVKAAHAAGQSDNDRSVQCNQLLATAEQYLDRMVDILDNSPELPTGYKRANRTDSIPLQRTIEVWRRLQDEFRPLSDIARRLDNGGCREVGGVSDFLNAYAGIEIRMRALARAADGRPHSITLTRDIKPNTQYAVTIEESFEGTATANGNVTFNCNPDSGQLTLSAGVLFSSVPDRAYEARKFPGMEQNVLVVEGNSTFRPEGVLLLNYLLKDYDRGTFGLALSAGPVIRFGSKSDVSTLGFFTGVSANLYRRFYVTPGFHFGEFADFPVGFHEGQAIPENFGELNPVKRWTTRFALGISFRTASFAGLGGSAAAEDSGKPEEKVSKKEGKGGGASRGLVTDAGPVGASGLIPANYHAATTEADYPTFARVVLLKSSETLNGTQVTLSSDSALTDYTTYTSSNALYIVLPHTKFANGQAGLSGRDLGGATVEQSGNNLVVSFAVPRGVTARVVQKFNRLQVSLVTGGSALAEVTR